MNTIKWILPTLAATLLLSGCFINIEDDNGISIGCLNADGPYVSQELDLATIDGIRNTTSVEVFIQQGNEQEVIVDGKEDAIDELELDVQNGIWEIEFDRCVRDLDEFAIYITLPTLRYISNSGSGDIRGENLFLVEDLEFRVSGSGDVALAAEADDIEAVLSGSGDLQLDGLADETVYRISGSGDVRAFGLLARTADLFLSGSGNADVTVEEFLRARISGSGDVSYKGNPELDVETSGSGEIIDAN